MLASEVLPDRGRCLDVEVGPDKVPALVNIRCGTSELKVVNIHHKEEL